MVQLIITNIFTNYPITNGYLCLTQTVLPPHPSVIPSKLNWTTSVNGWLPDLSSYFTFQVCQGITEDSSLLLYMPYHRVEKASRWRFLTTPSPDIVTHVLSVLEDENRMAVIAVLFLVNLHFTLLVSQYRETMFDPYCSFCHMLEDRHSFHSMCYLLFHSQYFQLFLWTV